MLCRRRKGRRPPLRREATRVLFGREAPLTAVFLPESRNVATECTLSENMGGASKACLSRLQKVYQRLGKEPVPNVVAEPK